jgi:hypothetical protein
VLADEEVTAEGRSAVGNYPVYRRPLRQWMLRITAYAERLLADLDEVDWPKSVKRLQRNWIGPSGGPYHLKDWLFSRYILADAFTDARGLYVPAAEVTRPPPASRWTRTPRGCCTGPSPSCGRTSPRCGSTPRSRGSSS